VRELPHPSLQAAVICDKAIQEAGTGKWSLIGLWTDLYAMQVPCSHPEMAVYFCISSAQGEYDWEVHLERLGFDSESLASLTGKLTVQDRLSAFGFAINLKNLQFSEAGRYAFRLQMNGKLVGDKAFNVKLMPAQESEG